MILLTLNHFPKPTHRPERRAVLRLRPELRSGLRSGLTATVISGRPSTALTAYAVRSALDDLMF